MMISETDRLSIKYRTNTYQEKEHYSSMFMDDFYKNIVPIYGSNYEFVQCQLVPVNEKFEEQLSQLLPSFQYRYNEEFNDIILGFIQFVAQNLINDGHLYLEFVKQKNINGELIFKLEPIYGSEVKIGGDYIIQIIHEDAAEQLNIIKPTLIPIEKCFIIKFPDSKYGKEEYLKFIEDFKDLGMKSPMLSTFQNPLSGQAGYDMTMHQRLHELELWKKSKVYNWHHRQNSSNLFSGYYHIYRYLKFRKSTIVLRDYIIEKLKEIILNFSVKCGVKTELQIEGLISKEKIDETLELWKTGELKPNSITEVL